MGCYPSRKVTDIEHSVHSNAVISLHLVRANAKSFLNEYHVAQALGTGSYGEVRTVVHKLTGQERAVKVFRKTPEELKSYEKVLNEIEILKKLHHPCIIQILEYFEDDKRLYIVMEKCSGGELFDAITKNKNLSENTAALICKQLFSAVAYMHGHSIMHRDLKPENILLEENDDFVNIKIIDFGTAVEFSALQRFDELVGSPFYVAPEVVNNNYSHECDMWSCGVLLFILLSGYPPFDGKNNAEILNRAKKGKFSFDKPIWQDVSTLAKDLISKLLTTSSKRLSANDALLHPWVAAMGSYPEPQRALIHTLKSNLTNFQSRTKLHNAISSFISSQVISNKDTRELREIFKSLDTNGDGKLSREELLCGLEASNSELIAEIMRQVDTDKNGYIDLEEFLVAAFNQQTLLSRENMKKAFDMFDLDGNGSVSYNELQTVLGLGNAASQKIWTEVNENRVKSSENEITFVEFCDLLRIL
jgi:calcium-dependent protein kinase